VHYDIYLEDGNTVDSSVHRNLPYQFELGASQVVVGLDFACSKMSVGELAEVTVPHLYAYGEAGCPPSVPPRAVLIVKLELLRVVLQK
jgi:FKBP-type peptidyl-prolyl cis-trans isomerase